MTPPDRVRDGADIRRLACRYAQAFDENDGELLASLFTADGAIEAPNGRFVGSEALRGAPAIVAARYLKTFHAVLNQTVEIDGDRATALTYGIARHLLAADGDGFFCREMTLRYADDCLRTGAGWRLTRRRLLLDWTHEYPVTPAPDAT
ncbi:MAG: nuclear transport factor 2 family protein [Sphingomonadaceae bacterium]|nr:nuclear transport factor 2 family protein [Sphingomonadaceae bacterium]